MSSKLLAVRDLQVVFGDAPAVRGVSFDIEAGETVALVGESGSGKSVTALSILQLLPYPQAHHPGGSVLVNGEEMLGADKARLLDVRGGVVSMIFQEPMTSLNPLHTIAKQVGEALVVHKRLSPKAARSRVLELLKLVGLQDAEGRLGAYPHELSGGQRQRVMIAMALANEPQLLIADEPTTALDVTIQAQILKLLRDLQQQMNMAMLLITHDLGIVRNMAKRVCVMTNGEIVEAGSNRDIFTAAKHPYTRKLLAAEPKGDPPAADAAVPVVAATERLTVKYPVGKGWFGRRRYFTAVDTVDIEVRAGQTVGVVGESGSGKTTLGLAMLRLLASEGSIRFDGDEIGDVKRRGLLPLRRDMQIVFQDPYGSLSPRLSVLQIVEEGCGFTNRASPRRSAERGWPRCWRKWGSKPNTWTAIRTSSPAASASASPSPGPWCCGRGSWCWTSRLPPWTCRCRRRSSICSATCSAPTPSAICSSATISRWCGRWRTGSSSCATA